MKYLFLRVKDTALSRFSANHFLRKVLSGKYTGIHKLSNDAGMRNPLRHFLVTIS